jgi:hypothetical protein
MKKLLRLAAVAVLGLSLTSGAVWADTATVGTTGPGSVNQVQFNSHTSTRVSNDSSAHIRNNSPLRSVSGSANVSGNTTGGNATSGPAATDSLFTAQVAVDTSGAGCGCATTGSAAGDTGTVTNTGPGSTNTIQFSDSSRTSVRNNSHASVTNNSPLRSVSGSANVSGNTTGGNATSGPATAVSTTDVVINVTQ